MWKKHLLCHVFETSAGHIHDSNAITQTHNMYIVFPCKRANACVSFSAYLLVSRCARWVCEATKKVQAYIYAPMQIAWTRETTLSCIITKQD